MLLYLGQEYLGFVYPKCIKCHACKPRLRFVKLTHKNVNEFEMINQKLRERDIMNTDAIAILSDKLVQVLQEIEIMKKQHRRTAAQH
jgi:hypothetical protein